MGIAMVVCIHCFIASLFVDMQQALLDPGPDLVICDEGHRIKNSLAGISKSLKAIKTKYASKHFKTQNNTLIM